MAAFFLFKKKITGEGFDFDFFETTEIAPQEQWYDILIGKWKVEIRFKSYKNAYVFTGDIEYKKDSTFNGYLTQKWFIGSYSNEAVKLINDDLAIMAGGNISGTWRVNNNMTWSEKYSNCSIEKSLVQGSGNKNFEPCKFYTETIYGTFKDLNKTSEIKCFAKNKILILSKDYKHDGNLTILLNKAK